MYASSGGYVDDHLAELSQDQDLSRYILYALSAVNETSTRHGVYGVVVAGGGYLVHGRLLWLLPFR